MIEHTLQFKMTAVPALGVASVRSENTSDYAFRPAKLKVDAAIASNFLVLWIRCGDVVHDLDSLVPGGVAAVRFDGRFDDYLCDETEAGSVVEIAVKNVSDKVCDFVASMTAIEVSATAPSLFRHYPGLTSHSRHEESARSVVADIAVEGMKLVRNCLRAVSERMSPERKKNDHVHRSIT